MATHIDYEELISKQEQCFESIKRISINYNKDGAFRKTLEYLNTRLSALEAHWGEFQNNDNLLVLLEDKNIRYFTENVFDRTKQVYNNIKRDMLTLQEELTTKKVQQSSEQNMGTGGSSPTSKKQYFVFPENVNTTPNNDIQQSTLLRQQRCNFNAFDRALSKIDLKNINEKWHIEDHLQSLKTKWENIEKIHWELDFLLQGTNHVYYAEFTKWEDRYDDIKQELNKKLWSNIHYEKDTPKMDIPTFNGNYDNWVAFKDLFFEVIHTNPLLSNTQKMQHLKMKLKGEAEKLVQHLSVSADNYDSCWDILQQRYNNKRLLCSSYINTLINQPTIQQANAYNIKKMHDTTIEGLNALHNIGLDISTWDPLVVHLLIQKLDATTYSEYIHDLKNPRDIPDLQEFLQFLESKFLALETVRGGQNTKKPGFPSPTQPNHRNNDNSSTNFKKPGKWSKSYNTVLRTCPLCNNNGHTLMQCAQFLSMSLPTRYDTVTKLQICKNCLYSHGGNHCASTKKCKTCNKPHHTLLHNDNFKSNNFHQSSSNATNQNQTTAQRTSNNVTKNEQEVLLTTVQLMVKNYCGEYIKLRALLDQGSQVTLITEDAAQRLRLSRRRVNAVVSGVGASLGNCRGLLQLSCKAIHSNFNFETEAWIMKKLVNNLPNSPLNKEHWTHLDNIRLADPEFYTPGPIDMLLGADVYSEIILDGVLKLDNDSPVAQQTSLGWILCGNVRTFNCHVTLNEVEKLSKFWECEEIQSEQERTNSDDYCEKYYQETTQRSPEDGRYIVKMPLKSHIETTLGVTKPQAVAQFLQLERKMAKNNNFAMRYKQFIDEYIELGHMTPSQPIASQLEVYLPHHGVIREDSLTTKLRVVFNASMPSSSKLSLNDLMEKGPNLQKDIQSLIITWRSYKYVLTADIEKMYRQILINADQQALQKIIWRSSPQEPLREMQLCTVTFGIKAAPWLALRTLQQLADEEGQAFPLAEKALRNHFYVDDVITGHNTIEGAKQMQTELYSLLHKGGFILRKWASNEPATLQHLSKQEISEQHTFIFKQDDSTKTLGLAWNCTKDEFVFDWELPTTANKRYSKRMLLSDISKIYDPLGWLAPTIIRAKLLFQKLWVGKIEWDVPLSSDVTDEWECLRSELPKLKDITLPRWLNSSTSDVELHGFCDASEKAYACVVYSKTKDETQNDVITLIAAKTKVAPLNKKTSLPRLELCGALLLTKLIIKVTNALEEYQPKIHCWTDSQVVLAWLQGDKNKWEPYVANRTTQINNIIPWSNWRHVRSKENPADCATRGLAPGQLVTFDLWWHGPQWLKTWKNENKENNNVFTTNKDIVHPSFITQSVQNISENVVSALLNKCSTIERATRVLAWALRFKEILRTKQKPCHKHLIAYEINNAKELIIKYVQAENFNDDMKHLKQSGAVSSKSNLLDFAPFLDSKGILRIGGRLQNSSLPEETKHPIILPHSGRLTDLIVQQAHVSTLHGGVRLTLAQTRQLYWILGGNRTVKKLLRSCVRCHRFRHNKNQQIMGNLPSGRVVPARPFTHCSVDFTGHVEVKINKGRGVKTCKGYIAIFVCMTTKAIHIELVSDLSTQTFLAALKRLCARRGTPKHIYSDNGTNFVGAARVLQGEFVEFETLLSQEFFTEITKLKVEWHFNCPVWPSANGLAEAAVKSMKFHLKRVLGEQKLTYEQFTTLLAQIEGCLNSRPLTPLSEDINDLDYLTPGHFLTGGPIMALPQEDYEDNRKLDIRNRWKLIEHMQQMIWKRWSADYLHQLQVRNKWKHPTPNITKGDLVLVKEDNLPPGKWAMGRVIELHPGADEHVRVVTLKTQSGELKRPITKLAPLPINDNQRTPTTNDSVEEKLHKDNNKRSHKQSSFFTVLMTSLMVFMMVSTSQAKTAGFKWTPLESNRSIYFDDVGPMQLMHDEWTILVYFNLTTYWQANRDIKSYINHMDGICRRLDQTQLCGPIISQLQHESLQIDQYNTLLLSHHLSRKRRGYFNGVGNLANALFGVLDDKFVEKYETDIQKLQVNEEYLRHLIKNQTLIIEAEDSIIKKNENFIKSQFNVLNTYMRQTSAKLAKIESRVISLAAMNDINASALTASLLQANLKSTQNMLLNALTDIYRGHLDMNLFTPAQLAEQLNYISGKMSSRLSLPVKNIQDDIREIYKIIYVKARITEQYLLFELHIPLTSDEEYALYRITPLPIKRENQTIMITTNSEYIAVNLRKNTYMSMEEKDLQLCLVSKENLLCSSHHPIHALSDKEAPCEAKILYQQTTLRCDSKQIQCTDRWEKLHQRNAWLYMCCGECTLRVMCEDQVSSAVINTTGLVTLGQGCVVQRKHTTIYSDNTFGSRMNLNTDVNIPSINTLNTVVEVTLKNKDIELNSFNTSEEHRDVIERLDYQKKQEEDLPNQISSHDVYHDTVSSALLVAGTVGTVYFIWRKLKKRSNRQARNKERTTHKEEIELEEVTSSGGNNLQRTSGLNRSFSFD